MSILFFNSPTSNIQKGEPASMRFMRETDLKIGLDEIEDSNIEESRFFD